VTIARTRATQAAVKLERRLEVADDDTLRIVVMADSHSHPHPRATELVTALHPDAILHAGDIGDLAVLDAFTPVCPLFAVRGNIDARRNDLPDVLLLQVDSPKKPRLRVLMTHYAVNGPKLRAEVARQANADGAAIVVCGHSHVPFIGRDKGLIVFNPGSLGPRRFALPIVFGLMDLSPRGLELRHINCETGEPWQPPG
jgi:putative phosphoesterase